MKKILFCLLIMISYSSLFAQYQLFNKDFEEWVEMPTNGGTVQYLTLYGDIWATSNEAAMVFLAEPSVTRTTDSYNGTYAAKIKTIQLGTSKGSGTLFTGKFQLNIVNPLSSTKFGIPFTDKPLYFKGFFKFTPVNGDSCRIATYLTKWNSVKKVRDTIAFASISREQSITATTTFHEFDIFYHYYINNTSPDSLTIVLASSADGANFKAAVGTTLIVDAISLEYDPLKVEKIQKQKEFLVYPNPSAEYLIVETEGNITASELKIYNSIGSLVLKKRILTNRENIPLSVLPSGFYYYSVSKADGTFESGKLFKK